MSVRIGRICLSRKAGIIRQGRDTGQRRGSGRGGRRRLGCREGRGRAKRWTCLLCEDILLCIKLRIAFAPGKQVESRRIRQVVFLHKDGPRNTRLLRVNQCHASEPGKCLIVPFMYLERSLCHLVGHAIDTRAHQDVGILCKQESEGAQTILVVAIGSD